MDPLQIAAEEDAPLVRAEARLREDRFRVGLVRLREVRIARQLEEEIHELLCHRRRRYHAGAKGGQLGGRGA